MFTTTSPSAAETTLSLARISRQTVQWLWRPWLARGVLTLLDGDPGMGKSTLALEVAAWVSGLGIRPPVGQSQEAITAELTNEAKELTNAAKELTNAAKELTNEAKELANETKDLRPGGVLILSAEDDPARVIRPRLEAAGADLERVYIVESVPGHPERPPQFPEDTEALGELIAQRQASLVIIDPFMAFLSRGVHSSNDQHVRRALHRLKLLAEETQCGMLIVRHLNKSSHMPALYRGGGSIGILGACRTAWVIGLDPTDSEGKGRVLAMNKCNLGDRPASLRFHLEELEGAAAIVFDGECDWTAAEVLGRRSEKEAEQLSRVEECAQYIRRLLARGSMPARELEIFCRGEGFAAMTIQRARKQLKVKALKTSLGLWELSLK